MAYSRYDRNSDWYIFWQSTKEDLDRERRDHPKRKEEEVLAIWHCDHRGDGPQFTYAEVRDMLKRDSYACIPGYSDADRELIRECLLEFVNDVDREREGCA